MFSDMTVILIRLITERMADKLTRQITLLMQHNKQKLSCLWLTAPTAVRKAAELAQEEAAWLLNLSWYCTQLKMQDNGSRLGWCRRPILCRDQ